jgi:hypothetical protein
MAIINAPKNETRSRRDVFFRLEIRKNMRIIMSVEHIEGAENVISLKPRSFAAWTIEYEDGESEVLKFDIHDQKYVTDIKKVNNVMCDVKLERTPNSFIAFVGRPRVTLEANGNIIYDESCIHDLVVVPTMCGITAYSVLQLNSVNSCRGGEVFLGSFSSYMMAMLRSNVKYLDERKIGTLSDTIEFIFDHTHITRRITVDGVVEVKDGMIYRAKKCCMIQMIHSNHMKRL